MDTKNLPSQWTPKNGHKNGNPKMVTEMDLQKWSQKWTPKICHPNGPPKNGHKNGPPKMVTEMDPKNGHINGHQEFAIPMDPQKWSQKWTPKNGHRDGPPKMVTKWTPKMVTEMDPKNGKMPIDELLIVSKGGPNQTPFLKEAPNQGSLLKPTIKGLVKVLTFGTFID